MILMNKKAAEGLRDCIEKARFYCVTPDAMGDINLSRSWMLQRAEDFINDQAHMFHFALVRMEIVYDEAWRKNTLGTVPKVACFSVTKT